MARDVNASTCGNAKPTNRGARDAHGLTSAVLLLLLLCIAARTACAQTGTPSPAVAEQPVAGELRTLEEMRLPSSAELLEGPPVDWIVLKTGKVLVVEPVSPRPDTLEKMEARYKASFDRPRPKTDEERKQQYQERQNLLYLELFLAGEADQPYRLHTKHVDEIIHFEDLFLRRVDRLLQNGRLKRTHELLFVLARRTPDWPGLEPRQRELLFREAEHKLEDGQTETAFVLLEELHTRTADFSGLKGRMGRVAETLIKQAVAETDYRRARHFRNRLVERYAEHNVAADWKQKLLARARRALDDARQAFGNGRYAEAAALADRAARTWPKMPELDAAYERIAGRYQRLKVGVLHRPDRNRPAALRTAADRRQGDLTEARLFEVDRMDGIPQYATRFFERWEPEDLGRRTVFTLRQSRPYWDSRPIVTAPQAVAAIANRIDPSHPHYDERLASYVDAVTAESPFRFTVHFARVPLRIQPLFRFPVSAGSRSGRTATGCFRLHKQTDNRTVYRRTVPQRDDGPRFHVAEINEVRYASYDKAVQGLLRGEVSLLPRVPVGDVARFRAERRLAVRQYALPRTHVLQFNPDSRSLGNRQLRRALAYALDRRKILDENILGDAPAEMARLVTGPFPSSSDAYNRLLELREPDPLLAISLSLAAGKQLEGGIPELTMLYIGGPVTETAVEPLVEQWSRIGIDVKPVVLRTADRESLTGWDLLYRTVRIEEPLVDTWPLLALDQRGTVASLAHLPMWLRQDLLELENAGNWQAAVRTLHKLHRHLQAEVHLIPLWEVDDFLVTRKHLADVPQRPIHTYQDVERWSVRPWYPTDEP